AYRITAGNLTRFAARGGTHIKKSSTPRHDDRGSDHLRSFVLKIDLAGLGMPFYIGIKRIGKQRSIDKFRLAKMTTQRNVATFHDSPKCKRWCFIVGRGQSLDFRNSELGDPFFEQPPGM